MSTNLIVRCCVIGLVTTSSACLGEESFEDESTEDGSTEDESTEDGSTEDESTEDDPVSIPTRSGEKPDSGLKAGHKDGGLPPPHQGEWAEPDEDCWPDAPSAKDAGAPVPRDAGKSGERRDGGKPDGGKLVPRRDGGVAPDAAVAVCSGRGIGSPNECLSYEEAEQRLEAECGLDGLELLEVIQKGDAECAPGTSHQAWGTCCVQQPEDQQAPDDCFVETVTQPVCSHPELYNQLADDQCSTRGNFFVPYLIARDDACPQGLFLSAEYWCCPDS